MGFRERKAAKFFCAGLQSGAIRIMTGKRLEGSTGAAQAAFLLRRDYRGKILHSRRALFISQPTLSQSIQAFEKELGFRLLTRTSTGVAATELGELVLADAKRVLAAAQEAQELEKAIHIVKKAYGELEEIKI